MPSPFRRGHFRVLWRTPPSASLDRDNSPLKLPSSKHDGMNVIETQSAEPADGSKPVKLDEGLPSADHLRARARALISRRKWPLVTTAVMVALGMVFMFYWNPLVHHIQLWAVGDDLWGMYRGAQYVSWGSIGQIYTPSDGIVTFPGMPILLAPAAVLAAKLHLSATFGVVLAKPTAALVLQPLEVLLSSTVVFAADALAEHLHVGSRRRIALCLVVGVIAWPTGAYWGHAEDALALALALYALRAALTGKWVKCGWLLGVGVVVQPLVALLIPLLVGASPGGRRLALAARSLALSVVLVGLAFVGDMSDTYRALIKQPTPPALNHATPWVALAPHIPVMLGQSAAPASTRIGTYVLWNSPHGVDVFVSAGPGRLIYVVLALLVGAYVWRHPQVARRAWYGLLSWCWERVARSRRS